jgi:TonB family protein
MSSADRNFGMDAFQFLKAQRGGLPVALNFPVAEPKVGTMFKFAFGLHVAMLIWNPTILKGGAAVSNQILMQVQYRDTMPVLPKPAPVVKKAVPKPVVKKAHKSGISLSQHAHPAMIHPVKHVSKVAAKPAARSRPAPVKMPKFIPHASDEDALAMASHAPKLAATTALRPASSPFISTPKLKGKSRGIRASDVSFKLEDRGSIAGHGSVVNIPIGEERGETASIATAPELHNAPKGMRHTSGYYAQAPSGEGVGELAGKNRTGYVGAIQVGEPSEDQVIAASNSHGSAAGHGFEIGGPVGDRKILRRHIPEYPAWAEEKGISAIVKIYFTVRPDGSIRGSLRIVHSSGYTELDSLAKDALLAWKFSPTRASSNAEEAWGVVTFRFTLA